MSGLALHKYFSSEDYKYNFDGMTGEFSRWGADEKDDPEMAPSAEILDIEISSGNCSGGCKFCYKSSSSTKEKKNMSLENFKTILSKFPKNKEGSHFLTQIAFGITDLDSNKEMWDIFKHTRSEGVVPNVTVNGNQMTDENCKKLVELCGAVAVSLYDYDKCYNAVEKLTSLGMKQTNIHCLLSKETMHKCHKLLEDWKTDPRLKNLNAGVFLMLKQKGATNTYTYPSKQEYKDFVLRAIDIGFPLGFDSCSANLFSEAIGNDTYQECIEPCESCNFSFYIDVEGKGYPCSFSSDLPNIKPIDLLQVGDFVEEVWNSKEANYFRGLLKKSCRSCPIYDISLR